MIPVLTALCILRFAQMKSMLLNNISAGETVFLCSVFALGKAMAAGYYDGWYEDAKALAGIPTAADVSYDDDGKPVG